MRQRVVRMATIGFPVGHPALRETRSGQLGRGLMNRVLP
jgi:hypothetical protein